MSSSFPFHSLVRPSANSSSLPFSRWISYSHLLSNAQTESAGSFQVRPSLTLLRELGSRPSLTFSFFHIRPQLGRNQRYWTSTCCHWIVRTHRSCYSCGQANVDFSRDWCVGLLASRLRRLLLTTSRRFGQARKWSWSSRMSLRRMEGRSSLEMTRTGRLLVGLTRFRLVFVVPSCLFAQLTYHPLTHYYH